VVDEYGIPASGVVTSGTVADCNQAPLLMEDLEAEAFLADKAYDTNELLGMLKEADITAVIPPVKSRKEQRAYSHELYRARHVIENVFRALKRWRRIATRYAKLTASFIAAIHVRCLFLYLPVHTAYGLLRLALVRGYRTLVRTLSRSAFDTLRAAYYYGTL
jgi:transposase